MCIILFSLFVKAFHLFNTFSTLKLAIGLLNIQNNKYNNFDGGLYGGFRPDCTYWTPRDPTLRIIVLEHYLLDIQYIYSHELF